MDVHAAGSGERSIRRIVAVLAALAVLAERAAGCSFPVRWFVVWILRRAEIVVEGVVFDETGMPPPLEGIAAKGDGPDDALRLAARFRALAAALATLLPRGRLYGRRPARRGLAFARLAPAFGPGLACWTRKPHDTS